MTNTKNNTGDCNTGNYNTGYSNTGDCNTGNYNTGDRNTGDYNTGNYNTGNYNTGYSNTGYRNTGYRNTGYSNTGYSNTGDCNTGNYNTGYSNTGYSNTGYSNPGDCNTGDRNPGDCNTGDYNTGNYNTGFFNTTTPKVRLFNFNSDLDFDSDLISSVRSIISDKVQPICTWVYEDDMTEEEKSEFETYETSGGYLKTRDYKYCWERGWERMTNEEKDLIKSLPNFCPKIFEEITGIHIKENKSKVTLELTDEQLEQVKKIIDSEK